jgi:hypothetical protein
MAHSVTEFIKRSRLAIIGGLLTLLLLAAGASLANPLKSTAAACDQVNIIYCGLAGSTVKQNIDSFQFIYNQGSDNGHSDLKTVFRWAGATDNKVTNMNTTNTKMGTLYRDGTIKVDGEVVGTDASITARFSSGAGFTEISPGVWARKTTTSFAQPSEPVLVHFNQDGIADFAVAVNCGNAITFTPKPPQPKPMSLTCESLTKELMGADQSLRYTFTAKAAAVNTRITHYEFYFGDGASNVQTVKTTSETATATHEYAHYNTDYSAHVVVYSSDFGGGKTSETCALTLHTAKKPRVETSNIACESLRSVNNGLTYTFTATSTATNTSPSSYVFYISDGTTERVPTTQTSAAITHTFASYDSLYTVYVTVTDGQTMTPQTTQCTLQFKTPKAEECKPGVPAGDSRCTECKPGVPAGSPLCNPVTPPLPPTTPTPTVLAASTLAKTGPADSVAIFVGATLAGIFLFRVVARRKLLG